MVVVNTNYASLIAQRSFNMNSDSLNTSMQRLSTGLRINSAVDDPAGLEIAARMTTQIMGLDQAARNANSGITLASTAESALGQQTALLNQIRVLAVQSTNGSNSANDRAALQSQVNQLKSQFDAISTSTSFNGIQLLNGSFTGQTFQIGAFAGQSLTLNVNSARGTAVGNFALTAASNAIGNGLGGVCTGITVAAFNGFAVAAQNVTISGAAVGIVAVVANSSALTIANQINANTAATGVSATATNSVTLSALANTGTVGFDLNDSNGFSIGNVSASITNTADLTALMNAVNASSSTTGVTATLSSASTASLILTSVDGGNIQIGNFTNTGNTLGATVNMTGLGGNVQVINNVLNDSAVVTGVIALSSTLSYSVTSNVPNSAGGLFANATAAAGNGAGAMTASLNSVSAIDISTATGAQTAINTVDLALQNINSARANLGATQTRFQASSANSTNTSIQMSSARSVIQDVDFASETAAFTKTQILVQAANAMLSQANSSPQSVLQLLQKL